MNLYIKGPVNNWPADDRELKALLGIKGKIPAEGFPPREVQGIRVWAESVEQMRRATGKPFNLRVFATCHVCGRTITVSRLKQHSKVHN